MPRRKTLEVPISVYVKWAAVSEPFDPNWIPADLAAAIEGLRTGVVTEEAACAIAKPYLVANFMIENLEGGDQLFEDANEVWSSDTEVNRLRFVDDRPFPVVTAAAGFRLRAKADFPADQDAMDAWCEDNGYLNDAVNFFWRFGTHDLVLGDYEEAGGGVDQFPGDADE
jgi:hypothetical protein